jgi:hypothetical protein
MTERTQNVSFGTFRKAVREPTFRNTPGAMGSAPRTPIGTFRKAVRVYHDDGAQAALQGLNLPSDYWRRPGRGRTLANNFRDSLRTYFRLDQQDGRPCFDSGVKEVVALGDETLNVYIDALVYDLFGHAARLALWDVAVPSHADAAVIATPVAVALHQVVGVQRTAEVSLWHLRTGQRFTVPADEALAHRDEATEALARAAG